MAVATLYKPYTVQRGDTLSAIGNRMGVPWRAIYDAPENATFRRMFPDPDQIDYITHDPPHGPVILMIPRTQVQDGGSSDSIASDSSAKLDGRCLVTLRQKLVTSSMMVMQTHGAYTVKQTITSSLVVGANIDQTAKGLRLSARSKGDAVIELDSGESATLKLNEDVSIKYGLKNLIEVGIKNVKMGMADGRPTLSASTPSYEVEGFRGQVYKVQLEASITGPTEFSLEYSIEPKDKCATGILRGSKVKIQILVIPHYRVVVDWVVDIVVTALKVIAVALVVVAIVWLAGKIAVIVAAWVALKEAVVAAVLAIVAFASHVLPAGGVPDEA